MRPVHWTLVMTLLTGVSGAGMSTVLSPYLHWAGYSLPFIGAIVSLRGIASLVSRLPGGLLYRPATARLAASSSCLLLAASTFAYIYTYSPAWVIGLRIVQGVTWGVASTLNLAMFYDTVPEGTVRGRLIATQGLFEVTGHSIGDFTSGWLLDGFGYWAALALAGVAAALAAFCPLWLPRSLGAPQAGRRQEAAAQPVAEKGEPPPWRHRLALLFQPGVLLPGAGYFSQRFAFQFLGAYFPLWALEAGFSYTFIGAFRGMQSLAGLVGRPVAGEATRLFRSETLLLAGLILSALSIMVIPSTLSSVALLAISAAGSLTRSASQVAMRLQLYEGTEARPETRGVSSGLFLACGDIGLILGPMAGGLVAGAWGLSASLQLTPVLCTLPIVALVVLYRIRRRTA